MNNDLVALKHFFFKPGSIFWKSSSQKSNEVFNCDFVASIVDLNVVAVNVDVFILEEK